MFLRKLLKYFFRIIGVFFLLIIIYFIDAICLSVIPANADFRECKKDAIEIYILTNGVHTDLVLPIKNEFKDWSKSVDPSFTKSNSTNVNYVAFGWGDKDFYLKTKTWSQLKLKTVFNAMFYLGNSAMHVTFYNSLQENKSCKKICIDEKSYLLLVDYIEESFDQDKTGIYKRIVGASYFNNDSFYDATGTYGLFFTCNTWANCGLKTANLRACMWTPFDKGIFYQYDK